MPAITPGYVKNMIRRSLREIVDPSPTKDDEQRIWKFFNSECAYCGKPLNKVQKQGHIDHLFPSSLGGPNHISNRVLSCATCNEAEKLDGAWQEFIIQKNPDQSILRTRIAKIHKWQKLNGKPILNQEKLHEIESLSESAVAYYDGKVRAARKLTNL
jgi:CRISPR/Cas system Type II protein with McrA/HNH and RuvC-like nuclease domain